jgi:DNA-binding NarL/FixJ family response regulator
MNLDLEVKDINVDRMRSRINHFFDENNLTKQERLVCLLIAKGMSNQRIATHLFIAPSTVKNHLYNIYYKSGVCSKPELIYKLLDLSFINDIYEL